MSEHSYATPAAERHDELIEQARAAQQRAQEAVTEARATVARARNIMTTSEAMRLDRLAEQRRG